MHILIELLLINFGLLLAMNLSTGLSNYTDSIRRDAFVARNRLLH